MASGKTILVTGGAGFIGANFVHSLLQGDSVKVVNLDALTYAGNLSTLASVSKSRNYEFMKGSIGDRAMVEHLLAKHQPFAIVNFAAETHVDRSIDSPGGFVQT